MANEGDGWRVFQLDALRDRVGAGKARYKEFLSVPALSLGLYHLPAGSRDMQGPHDEDEVYLVLEGKARMKINDQEQKVEQGTLLYVRATEEHSFFEIEEDMTLLVMFANGK